LSKTNTKYKLPIIKVLNAEENSTAKLNNQQKAPKMKVIYAGFPKCGTTTISEVLKTLGYTCQDLPDSYTENYQGWMKVMEGKCNATEEFRRMFGNVDAVADSPACFYWKEILEAFPDAKVLMGTRESEEVWYKSFRKQLDSIERRDFQFFAVFSPEFRKVASFINALHKNMYGLSYEGGVSCKLNSSEHHLKSSYRRHNADVIMNCPKDKLLMVNLAEGWEPICEFLGKPVPDVQFPHKNKNASQNQDLVDTHPTFQKIKKQSYTNLTLSVALVSFLIYSLVF